MRLIDTLMGCTKQWVHIWFLSCSTGQVLSADSYAFFVSLSLGFTVSQGITLKWWLALEHATLQHWLFETLLLLKDFPEVAVQLCKKTM